MDIYEIKVYITRNGNGAISYKKGRLKYKVLISKKNNVLKEIFDKYFSQLEKLKFRHYAIAKWIVRDIRNEGFVFKAYVSNIQNIRPVIISKN